MIYIYIEREYIYIERERNKEREGSITGTAAECAYHVANIGRAGVYGFPTTLEINLEKRI